MGREAFVDLFIIVLFYLRNDVEACIIVHSMQALFH
jgi:hypothetical protein